MKVEAQVKNTRLKTIQSVELFDETMHRLPVRQVIPVIAAAMLTLLVFNSESLLNWSTTLPVGPVGDFIVKTAGQWHDLMETIGAARVQQALHQAFQYFTTC